MPPALPSVVALFGPTASGKTAVARALATRIPGEIVSADSASLYRGLPILTAAPPAGTRLAGVFDLSEEVSVGAFAHLAHAAIDEIVAAGRTALVAGGTGLYLRAALAELALPPAPGPGERERWARLYDRVGGPAAHGVLAERDPAAAARVHANDRRRVVRALELAAAGSSLAPARDALWSDETRLPTLIIGLDVPSAELDRRIELRTRAMFDAGVVDEVRAAAARPLSATARKIMGLELIAELGGDAYEPLVQATKRFARYQRKWMRRLPGLVSVRADQSADEVADAILALGRPGQRVPAHRAGAER
ncbi:MAG TPA: tRNA (adenosine(37)-N6)-dimethylallyltransferase MiaA [Gaiellaceae bacterium]|jgi:tRNA dimethylallyltransferase|nr:tRNA (adenosine(37)-N6)-dimethylallyltransferase MiaA [Gaiellaceae bacterium]